MRSPAAAYLLLNLTGAVVPAMADESSFSLTLKDHRFAPAEVTIPANTRVRLLVRNLDSTPAEFESDNFKAEKVIPAGQEVVVRVPALAPGIYEFHDEYHEAASKSRLVVK